MFSHLFSSLNLGLAATHEKVSMRVCEQPRFDDGGLGPFATFGCLVAKIEERKVIGGSTAKAKTVCRCRIRFKLLTIEEISDLKHCGIRRM